MKIHFQGEFPRHFEEAFRELSPELDFQLSESGYSVVLAEGDCLELVMEPENARLTYSMAPECWRGLSLLSQHWGQSVAIREKRAFQTLGFMFDVSRNGVLKIETIRFFLRKLAMLGFNLGMLYTEDTYEVPEYPYFGYLRGRYSKQELRQLDDYADLFGIELCPCIQTLGHLNRALHWPAMEHMKDTEEVLLVGEPSTYDFIRAMLKNASEPFRSKKIHIGMDEAHFLGQGAYLRRHGYVKPFTIMREHLERVSAIVRELGLEAMMWSDMYFRLASPTGGYYDSPEVPKEVVDQAPKDIGLVYWDYYHQDEQIYSGMLQKHEAFGVPVAFAGGIWTWTGPAPDQEKTVAASLPGLRQAKAHGIQTVLAAAWGDNGAEANLLTALYGLSVYAEFSYTGEFKPEWIARRFQSVMHCDGKCFLNMTRFNQLPGVKNWEVRPVNAAKFLLYQDPLIPLYQADLEGVDIGLHYRALAEDYDRYARENPAFSLLLAFYAQLARALEWKCRFHQEAGACVRRGDRSGAKDCAQLARKAREELEQLRRQWRDLWNSTNKPYGFEILDVRLGGVAARMDSVAQAMEAFAKGDSQAAAPLAEKPLPYTLLPDGALKGSYAWGEIVSACKVDL